MAFAGTKMVNQLEGSWPATVLSNAPGVGPWLGLIASEIPFCWIRCGSGATGFADFRSGLPLPMPYRAPYARDPWGMDGPMAGLD